jgi:hypothetical protein
MKEETAKQRQVVFIHLISHANSEATSSNTSSMPRLASATSFPRDDEMPHSKRRKTATSQLDIGGVVGHDKEYISLSDSSDDEGSETAAESFEYLTGIVQAEIDMADEK